MTAEQELEQILFPDRSPGGVVETENWLMKKVMAWHARHQPPTLTQAVVDCVHHWHRMEGNTSASEFRRCCKCSRVEVGCPNAP